jgi:hypothetical protein
MEAMVSEWYGQFRRRVHTTKRSKRSQSLRGVCYSCQAIELVASKIDTIIVARTRSKTGSDDGSHNNESDLDAFVQAVVKMVKPDIQEME